MQKDVNEKLIEATKSWQNEVFLPYVKDKTDNGKCLDTKQNGKLKKENAYISCPFQMGLTDSYIDNTENKPRLMIIGQEPTGFGVWHKNQNDDEFLLHNLQEWAIEYIQKQLNSNYQSHMPNIKSNSSYFWNLFKNLSKNFTLCWTDVDKVYFDESENNTFIGKGTLTTEAEEVLSKQYALYGETVEKSLLQREIELANPDIILFITGPNYTISMETAFGLDKNLLKGKLNKENNFLDITDIFNINKKVFWTYHPRYAATLGMNITENIQKHLL